VLEPYFIEQDCEQSEAHYWSYVPQNEAGHEREGRHDGGPEVQLDMQGIFREQRPDLGIDGDSGEADNVEDADPGHANDYKMPRVDHMMFSILT
jgi:hypothetical protein